MLKVYIIGLFILLTICISSKAQFRDINNDIYPDSLSIVSCKIVKIKHHKCLYDIYATANDSKIRILSIKEKCKGIKKIRIGKEYKIILNPYFSKPDTLLTVSLPNYILVNETSISVFNNYSPYIYFGINLKGLYYMDIIDTLDLRKDPSYIRFQK